MSSVHTKQYQAFLRKLRQARIDSGLTQAQVAKALKKPQSFVSKCESGERRVDFTELQGFARLYKRAVGFFEA